MEVFEKRVGEELKKHTKLVWNVNDVPNLGDWLYMRPGNLGLCLVECKNWRTGYSLAKHKRKQPKQFEMQKKLPLLVISNNVKKKSVEIYSLLDEEYLVECKNIKEAVKKIYS